MSETRDDVVDAVTKAAGEMGMRLMSEEELTAFMAEGEKMIAAADEQAREEGKTFLDEERDRAIIDGWYAEAEACDSIERATSLIGKLTTEYRHDYGTMCHATAAASVAVTHAFSRMYGLTGFQAGAIMWEFCRHWMGWRGEPRRLVDYSKLLYPQYEAEFTAIDPKTWEWAQAEAKKQIAETDGPVHPNVRAHWERVAAGEIPFGLKVAEL